MAEPPGATPGLPSSNSQLLSNQHQKQASLLHREEYLGDFMRQTGSREQVAICTKFAPLPWCVLVSS